VTRVVSSRRPDRLQQQSARPRPHSTGACRRLGRYRTAAASERVGLATSAVDRDTELRLRRINRIRTIQGTLAIEGNKLTSGQITAVLDGKRV
jgi:hypothetical protein